MTATCVCTVKRSRLARGSGKPRSSTACVSVARPVRFHMSSARRESCVRAAPTLNNPLCFLSACFFPFHCIQSSR
ncbi:uncharacterized protein K452DRAFT_1123 [Aplosporella prunicola CBS 121167]|uniref:Uncharacterized protein n=1 Tax=Aplosporella prunicola CBS 121167 TaxID=1176127 RepID=A0A6A6BUW2_9PEZI|nr:uncharacterized protein K452DRAFT_1123 [Aplosporella prunicola CBS 121167]KAF2147065.1 hypothetical protein K452DRAFT_1123 [Aplosporella prunicola CBS 121167]